MAFSGSGGGRKRRKKYTDETHRKNAEKQAKWRRENPSKVFQSLEREKIARRINKATHKPGGFLIYERVTESGEIIAVRIRHHLQQPPANERLSDFLPHTPVDWLLAKALRDARLAQLKEWSGGA